MSVVIDGVFMKRKALLIVAAVVLGIAPGARAGSQFSISFGGGYCRSYPIVCPAPIYCYPPVVYYYNLAPYYYYGSQRFSNVSPVVTEGPPIYKISNPIYVSEPITVYEGVRFGWRK